MDFDEFELTMALDFATSTLKMFPLLKGLPLHGSPQGSPPVDSTLIFLQ